MRPQTTVPKSFGRGIGMKAAEMGAVARVVVEAEAGGGEVAGEEKEVQEEAVLVAKKHKKFNWRRTRCIQF